MTAHWTDADRDTAYTKICEAVSAAGPEHETQFLARLTLLLAEEVSNLDAVARSIDLAAQTIPPAGQR